MEGPARPRQSGLTASAKEGSQTDSVEVAAHGLVLCRLWLGFFAAIVTGHHVETEQAAFECAVVERCLARFFETQQFRQAEIGREQEHAPARETLFEGGAEGAEECGQQFIGRQRAVAGLSTKPEQSILPDALYHDTGFA